jgi:hypothetical protein
MNMEAYVDSVTPTSHLSEFSTHKQGKTRPSLLYNPSTCYCRHRELISLDQNVHVSSIVSSHPSTTLLLAEIKIVSTYKINRI